MNRFIGLLLASASMMVLLASCSGASTQSKTGDTAGSASRAIRVGVEERFPAFETIGATNREPAGFDLDMMKAIAAKAGLNIQFVNVGKDRLLTGVLNCEYDAGISAISIRDDLKQQMAFSDPYLTVGQVIIVKKGNIVVAGWNDLTGMTVGTQTGSPSALVLQNLSGVQPLPYPTFEQAFRDLITGNIDAVVANEPWALTYVNIPANNLKIVGDKVGAESLGIAICPQKPELAAQINRGLAAIKADGTLDRLMKRWLKGLSSVSG